MRPSLVAKRVKAVLRPATQIKRQNDSPPVIEGFFNGQAFIGEPRCLLLDIESSTNLAHVWGKYEQDVIEFERHWYMLCFSYKWIPKRSNRRKAITAKEYGN